VKKLPSSTRNSKILQANDTISKTTFEKNNALYEFKNLHLRGKVSGYG